MAVLYMRPTSDVYVNHTLYPDGSANAYALLNESVSDGSSTYIGVTAAENSYTTVSSSFMFSGEGISLPSKDCIVEKITVCFDDSPASTYADTIVTCQLECEEIIQVSNVCVPNIVGVNTLTFNTNNLETKFTEYNIVNGKLPNVKMILTTHATSTKSSATYGITQLYIKVEYHLNTFVRSTSKYVTGGWLAFTTYRNEWNGVGRVYKKINGKWSEITSNGRTQITNHLNKLGHDLEPMEYKAPTCGSTGLTEGCKCYRCNQVLVPQEVIPITGSHTPTDVSAVSATCNADGYTAGTKCSTCNTYLSGHAVIPATGNHTVENVEATEPTCGASGYTAGTKCSTCNTYLSGHAVIPATGNHTYISNQDEVAATYTDMGLTSTMTCSVCGNVPIRNAIPTNSHTCTPIILPAVKANCTYTGLTQGSMCSVCGCIIIAQEEIPINGEHNYVTDGVYQICSICSHVKELGITINVLQANNLDSARSELSATTVGNYAIFGGGDYTDKTDAYDISLTKASISALQDDYGNGRNAATTVGNYALFGGGYYTNKISGSKFANAKVTAFSSSLSRTYPSDLEVESERLAATTIGNYALLAGGYADYVRVSGSLVPGEPHSYRNNVTAYNSSLTKSIPSVLSVAR